MAHRKREYDANSHQVTIQQVNPDGEISAWIDGYAAHEHKAIDRLSAIAPDTVVDQVSELQDSDKEWQAVEVVLAFMADNDLYFCSKCESFYDSDNVVRTKFAGHKCIECKKGDDYCPDNPNGDSHEWDCLNPRQKHNARMPTKYKCEHCGKRRRTMATG